MGGNEDEENHWLSLPVEIIEIILCWEKDTSAAESSYDSKAAFAAHSIICLVCRQWRDCIPLPPRGFRFCFGPAVAMQGSVSLLQWAKEIIPVHAWDSVACCVAAKGGHFDVLKWFKEQIEDRTPL